MALNKYMHPRNIYKTPPDFLMLSKSYEEFSSIAKKDITGKVTIDFKDPRSLRVLTKCLLKSDFGLDVVIPEDRLVPTLPLRLNYVLWIEDLLNSVGRKENIKGLDIGTGACAIYPLLAAVTNKWYMLGTETDKESIQKAQENIERNNLQHIIQLSKNPTSSLMEYLFADDGELLFDFCMCNPPFYSNIQELCESRSPARLPPKNGFTGSPQELITEGGELSFCRKMIEESKIYKDKVLIFTTMIGHKYNLRELMQDLTADNIQHTSTEFCQGRVTRWGLAWTFKDLNISKLVPARDKLRKKSVPIEYLLQEIPGLSYDIDTVSMKLLLIMQDLKISYKILNKRGNILSVDMKAVENTWSNQRRKRRLMKLSKQGDPKKPKLEDSSDMVDGALPKIIVTPPDDGKDNNTKQIVAGESNVDDNVKVDLSSIDSKENDKKSDDTLKGSSESKNINTELSSINNELKTATQHNDSKISTAFYSESFSSKSSIDTNTLVHAFFKVLKKDKYIFLEMEFLDGSAGKEGLHQIMQYIKNHWK
ncbi:U6 small nuclear RNA (adenine-(43)-N(6))-methyltransferase [Pectinophora gossypiella]|uniref:U6 small nuclear RNA (adenine-(43)-N(6))-methyltransferase n=1 Tax=Pectinophora gossypiella TaxID=13191 RepID=UPI00214F5D48|nr:U6 small nuclear RNA (adenine-(43)-N(6))-methyltransferase [Pectinophora gossypiella]